MLKFVKSLLREALGDVSVAKRIGHTLISFVVVVLLMLMWLLIITGLQWRYEEIKVIQGNPEPTREELRKAMRYHGILYAEQDDNGEWYFIRDGKRCRLFVYKEK
jgi:hypothetical protein